MYVCMYICMYVSMYVSMYDICKVTPSTICMYICLIKYAIIFRHENGNQILCTSIDTKLT